MRRVIIEVTCDACQEEIEEETERSNAVTFEVRNEKREMDLCDECIGGTFLQEARPVTSRKKQTEKPFSCDACDKTFGTRRGLNHHKTKMHEGSE